MRTIQQKFTGDAGQLEREYEKILKKQIALEEQLGKVKRKADDTSKGMGMIGGAATKAVDTAVNSVKNLVLQYVGVSKAIELVVSGLKNKEELEKRAAARSMTVADAEAQVAINFGDGPGFEGFISKMGEIQRASGFQSIVPILQAASTTLSAVAGDQKVTSDILSTLAPVFKSAPDDMAQVSQVVGDLMLVSQTSAKETTGLVLATMGQARVTSLQAFKNVAPAIAGSVATQTGVDPKRASTEAAAAFAAIGSVIKDSEGALTRTAVANLSANLAGQFKGDFSLAERLRMAQGSSNEIKDELVKSGFEGAVKPVIRQLLDPNSAVAKSFEGAIGKIGFDAGSVDRMVTRLEGGTLNLALASQTRAMQGRVEQGDLSPQAVIAGNTRDIFNQAINTQTDLGLLVPLNRWVANRRLDAAQDKDAAALELLTEWHSWVRKGRIEGPRFGEPGSLFGGAPMRSRDELNDVERQQLNVIEKAMEAIQQNQKRNEARNGAAIQSRQQAERD